jgi:hypothetical protein
MVCSEKGKKLLAIHKAMVWEDLREKKIDLATTNMEIRAFRDPIRNMLRQFQVSTLLDYGCGGGNYELPGFDGESSAKEFFDLEEVFSFQPARYIDQRQKADAVLCFDLLEHLFIADLQATVRDMFSLADRLLIVHVSCYAAVSALPNGENAHVTVRPPQWWKGLFDSVAVDFPAVSVWLICSTSWRVPRAFEVYSAMDWLKSSSFVTQK